VLTNLANLQTTPLSGATPDQGAGCGTTGSVNIGDDSGALVWDLADLPDGDSETFTITKDATPIIPENNEMPEPASLVLFGTALIGLAARRRRHRT
jgi:hypothetical protein